MRTIRRLAACLHRKRPETPEAARLRTALSMRDTGIGMYRERMRRENPGATGEAIDAMVTAWLRERPQDPTLPPPPGRTGDDNH